MESYCLPSLMELSVRRLTRIFGNQTRDPRGDSGDRNDLLPYSELVILPSHLKDSIRDILLKRQQITPSDLQSLLHPHVKEIDLSEQVVTVEHLSCLGMLCGRLRKINLNHSIQSPRCAQNMTNVRDERNAASPTETGSDNVSVHLSLLFNKQSFLTTVYLRGLSGVTCDVISTLASSCPQLSHLDLGGCPHVDDAAVEELRVCNHLHSLSLAKTIISDLALNSLAKSYSREYLSELRIDSCHMITDDGIEVLLEHLGGLQILIFHGCPNVTERARESIEEYLTNHNRVVKQLTWTVY